MTRPRRIEYPGALYHVTSRGNRREAIYLDDSDRHYWLELLGNVCRTFRFSVYAYCQMGNHYHLLLRTAEGKLSRGMRYLNGEYSRHFNQRHERVGHVFQGRYQAILCQDERYLQSLARYIVLNPVRACLVAGPGQWPWSSFPAAMGAADVPRWLDVPGLLRHFGDSTSSARLQYHAFVMEGIGKSSPLATVCHQLLLGDPDQVRALRLNESGSMEDITRTQRQLLVPPLAQYFVEHADRDRAMAAAYSSLAYSMGHIARYCGVSTRTVSRAVAKHSRNQANDLSQSCVPSA
jgi:REP element-mobilizing transposase RayT